MGYVCVPGDWSGTVAARPKQTVLRIWRGSVNACVVTQGTNELTKYGMDVRCETKRELISHIWGKRGATYGEKGVRVSIFG